MDYSKITKEYYYKAVKSAFVFGIIIAFVTGGGEHEKVGALNRIGIDWGKLFGGGGGGSGGH